MRMAVAVCVVCVAFSTARADDSRKAIDTAIRDVLDGSQTWSAADGKAAWYERLGSAKVFGPSGAQITTSDDLERELGDCSQGSRAIGEIDWKLGTPVIGVDAPRGFAWFQAPASIDVACVSSGFAGPVAADKLRTSGILVLEKGVWQLAALALSRPLPDAELFKGATKSLASGDPTLDGTAPATSASAWFTKGGFKRGSSKGAVVASGTAPKEYATGAAAARLAIAWDKLRLRAERIDASMFAHDTIAMVRVDVPFPRNKSAAPMTLFAIMIVDGTQWRWVSLQFTTELALPPQAEVPDTSGIECPHGKC